MSIKRIIKIILIIVLLYVSNTNALYTTNNNLINTLHTIKYNLQIDASGGYFLNKDIIINKDDVVLPIPEKKGYSFRGYIYNDNIYSNKTKISEINNKKLITEWNLIDYSIKYNLNGGKLDNVKSKYNIEEEFIIPNPTKEGFIFDGWTGNNLDIPIKNLKIEKGSIGDIELTANWSETTTLINVIPIVDNIEYKNGYADYTFDIYINDILIVEHANVWNNYVKVGDKVRVIANTLSGRNTTYDETRIIENNNEITFYPTWSINSYNADFYFNNNKITTTTNKFGSRVTTPNLIPSNLGYHDSFYIITGYSPQETWIQPDRTIKFTINLEERQCSASFGSASQANAEHQLLLINRVGYNFCHVTNWGSVECSTNCQRVLDLYYNVWYILPRSGNGFSVYKQISSTSGWSTYERR